MKIVNRCVFLEATILKPHTIHLFEHLFIDNFLDYLQKNDVNPGLFGWIDGRVIQNYVFIDANFYTQKAAMLFDKYIKKDLTFTEQQISQSLQTVETEMRSTAIFNKKILIEDLTAIAMQCWNIKQKARIASSKKDISFAKNKKDYRDITITVELRSKVLDLQKLFLRVYVIILDLLDIKLKKSLPFYSRGHSPITVLDGLPSGIKVATIKNDIKNIEEIQGICQKTIDNFNVKQNIIAIKRHFSIFANEPLLQNLMIHYYQYADIITNNQEITKLATQKNLQKLFRNIRITVNKTNKDDLSCL